MLVCEHGHALSRTLAVHFILLNLLDLFYPLTRQLEQSQVSNEVAVCVTEAGRWVTVLFLFFFFFYLHYSSSFPYSSYKYFCASVCKASVFFFLSF